MIFDDEQIADEKSIANMKLKYAGLKPFQKVGVLNEKSEIVGVKNLGKLLRREEKYLSFLSDLLSGDAKTFAEDLKRISHNEHQKLSNSYSEIEKCKDENPEFLERPKSIYELNKKMAQNEIDGIKELFELFLKEKSEENREMIESIIKRRLDALLIMFVKPNFR